MLEVEGDTKIFMYIFIFMGMNDRMGTHDRLGTNEMFGMNDRLGTNDMFGKNDRLGTNDKQCWVQMKVFHVWYTLVIEISQWFKPGTEFE